MEDKSPNQKSLDDLPKSDDKEFWGDAEIHTGIVPHDILAKHGHYFVRISGHQAYCEGCGWGFQLEWGDEIIDGHLYNDKGELVL